MSRQRRAAIPQADAGDDGPGPEMAPGIRALELPLPFGPRRVSAWLLEDGDGWTVVDCGADTPEIRRIWADALPSLTAAGPVRRIIATHGHVDHVGHAGPLWERLGRPEFLISRTEWLSASLRQAAGAQQGRSDDAAFFARHGVPGSQASLFTARPGALGYLAPLPGRFRRIAEGDVLRIGGRSWSVITSGGHAPEHVSLYCAEDALLIAGDQVLPRITPFIGVFPSEPDADPLGDFLSSLKRFATLAEGTLVLPSHGPAFRGLHGRLSELREHHAARLSDIAAMTEPPASAYAIACRVFARAMHNEHRRLALAETLAHLNLLCREGRVRKTTGADGIERFHSA